MAVEVESRPLKVKTRSVAGSKMMQSGPWPVGVVPSVLRVLRSKIVTVFAPPSLMKPRPDFGSKAMPWTPCVLGMSPTTAPVSAFSTVTCEPREM